MGKPQAALQVTEIRGDCYDAACPARMVLSHLSTRWGSLIVASLRSEGTLRFSELRRRIEGISEKVLSQKLRELERDGLITRKTYSVVPPHVEYTLSPAGRGVAEHVAALVSWVEEHIEDFTNAQKAYDTRYLLDDSH